VTVFPENTVGGNRPSAQNKSRKLLKDNQELWRTRLRYLPPYSPDLNPIEHAFAKLKAHLRKVKFAVSGRGLKHSTLPDQLQWAGRRRLDLLFSKCSRVGSVTEAWRDLSSARSSGK
jgi:transposase